MCNENGDAVAARALAIAARVGVAGPGDRAALRRMGPDGAPEFWRLVAKHKIGPQVEASWLVFCRLVALLTPTGATHSIHDPAARLGKVFADGGDGGWGKPGDRPVVSEERLARLLAARGPARLVSLERVIRSLARRAPKVNVVDLAWAVLSADTGRLARSYYGRLDGAVAKDIEDASHD